MIQVGQFDSASSSANCVLRVLRNLAFRHDNGTDGAALAHVVAQLSSDQKVSGSITSHNLHPEVFLLLAPCRVINAVDKHTHTHTHIMIMYIQYALIGQADQRSTFNTDY